MSKTRSLETEGPAASKGLNAALGCLGLFVVILLFSIFSDQPAPNSDQPAPGPVPEKRTDVQPVSGGTLIKPAAQSRPVKSVPNVTLASWAEWHTPAMVFRNTLVHRGGSTILLLTRYYDGSSSVQRLAECPTKSPNARRFDLDPESDRSEYITLTDSGVVRYFDWAGQQFMAAQTTSIHADFLTVGVKPRSADCVPKELSATSKEIVGLYEQLRNFKDDREFEAAGFAESYGPWMEAAQRLHAESSPADSLDELGFLAGDVLTLGLDYASAGGDQLSQEAQDLEDLIHAGLALSTCDATQ